MEGKYKGSITTQFTSVLLLATRFGFSEKPSSVNEKYTKEDN